jgi:hypothetical protein
VPEPNATAATLKEYQKERGYIETQDHPATQTVQGKRKELALYW